MQLSNCCKATMKKHEGKKETSYYCNHCGDACNEYISIEKLLEANTNAVKENNALLKKLLEQYAK